MAEAVVVLPPDVRSQQIIQRSDRAPPRNLLGHLQPLGVLVEHRVDDVDERLVTGEKAVPPGQQVSLRATPGTYARSELPSPGHSLPDVRRWATVGPMKTLSVTSNSASSRFDAVSSGPKTRKLHEAVVHPHDVAQKPAQHASSFGQHCTALGDLDLVIPEIRHGQIFQQQSAVGVRIGSHSPRAAGRQFLQLGLSLPLESKSSSGR